MPLYTFECNLCKDTQRRLIKKDQDLGENCHCGGVLERQLPTELTTTAMEMRDKHRGVQLRKGHDQIMKKRLSDHDAKYELAEKIDKNGIKDAERLGWTKKIKKV